MTRYIKNIHIKVDSILFSILCQHNLNDFTLDQYNEHTMHTETNESKKKKKVFS